MTASVICSDVPGQIAETTWRVVEFVETQKLRRVPLHVHGMSVHRAAVWCAGDGSHWTLREVPVLFCCVSVKALKVSNLLILIWQLILNREADVTNCYSVQVFHLSFVWFSSSFGIWPEVSLKRRLQFAALPLIKQPHWIEHFVECSAVPSNNRSRTNAVHVFKKRRLSAGVRRGSEQNGTWGKIDVLHACRVVFYMLKSPLWPNGILIFTINSV